MSSMSDLIRRGDLLKPDEESDKLLIIGSGKTVALAERLMKRKIETVPAVDAVEVVRCRECKHFWSPDKDLYTPICRKHRGLVDPTEESYCSYGERKDNE